MNESIKIKDKFVDSTGVVHNKELLSVILEELNKNKIYNSGTNSSGSWIKWENGIMICFGKKTFENVDVRNHWGNVFETADKFNFGSFPQEFTDTPSVGFNQIEGGTVYLEAPGTTSTRIADTWFMSPVERSNNTITFTYFAIGFWEQR